MKAASTGRWLVVYIANGKRQADEIARLLASEGFLPRVCPLGGAASDSAAFELRVLACEAAEARDFLMDSGL